MYAEQYNRLPGLYRRILDAALLKQLPLFPNGRPDKGAEQGMRFYGPRLEFGMELTPEEPWMVAEFYYLDEFMIGREAAYDQSLRSEQLPVFIVEFITVAMPFRNLLRTVSLKCMRTFYKHCRICAKPHGASHLGIRRPLFDFA